MKGFRSETIRPHPVDVIKEVLANAVVHREYDTTEPVIVTILPDAIRVESPGGLEQNLLRRLLGDAFTPGLPVRIPRDLLQRRIEHGDRGEILKAYRNAVVADLFYGTGLVDKAGSGLFDAMVAMEGVSHSKITPRAAAPCVSSMVPRNISIQQGSLRTGVPTRVPISRRHIEWLSQAIVTTRMRAKSARRR